MNDLISRQAAIDLINVMLSQPCKNHTSEFVQGMEDGYCRIRSDIKCLPSAQPGIIRCKDCKYADDDGVCQNSVGLVIQDDDDFCSKAERRQDAIN